ncbi:MAG TPA: ATP-binding cassette domain-containing protein [Pedobacter sp.]|jgi:ABC-type Mn2+/Zn2+ transport system ATPase subunit
MAILNLVNAGFQYSGTDKWVFRHFNMTIETGEVVRVKGRNGSGKSTLLKVLSGLLKLTEGKCVIQQNNKVAYMDQFSGEMLARDLTISEQLKAVAVNDKLTQGAPVEMLTEFGLGLQNRTDEFIGHLSGGQRQIVALLCTLLAGATILCLDEFSSSMDERSIQVADKLLLHAKTATNITFILVSHSKTALVPDRELDIASANEPLKGHELSTEG